jgi:hypothetical protein
MFAETGEKRKDEGGQQLPPGRPHEEWRVLAAARVLEEALGGWQPPPEPLPKV